MLSPQEIAQLSELEVLVRDMYDMQADRAPMKHGVLDRRLGTSDKKELCETCGHKMQDCVGHFGHIRLMLPVFHIGYFRSIITILQNICKVIRFHPLSIDTDVIVL